MSAACLIGRQIGKKPRSSREARGVILGSTAKRCSEVNEKDKGRGALQTKLPEQRKAPLMGFGNSECVGITFWVYDFFFGTLRILTGIITMRMVF